MSLPVSALNERELIRYAAIDDGARAELARRLSTSEGLMICDQVEDLEAQVAELQRAEDESFCSCSCADDSESMEKCIDKVRKILKGHKDMDHAKLTEAVEEALNEMIHF